MKIAAADLALTSRHGAETRHEIHQSQRLWAGQEPPRQAPPETGRVELSQAGQAAAAGDTDSVDSASKGTDGDPRLGLIRTLVEFLTGRKIRVFDASELKADTGTPPPDPSAPSAPSPPAGLGAEFQYHESYSESERLDLAASGTIRTADGREIGFSLSLTLERSLQVESDVSLQMGDAARRKDPLVVNFSATSAELASLRFSFDLDADGSAEDIPTLAPGSGFLALDRNGDGAVNDGSELFGTRSGDGFQDLAALDSDGNGWIDEGDPAYDQLQVWRPGAAAASLREAGIGALALARAATPFQFDTGNGANIGQLRSSGIFLRENGVAGTIQQIDLSA